MNDNMNELTRAIATFAESTHQARRERFAQLDANYWSRREQDAIPWQSFGLGQGSQAHRVVDLGCGPASVLHDLWHMYGSQVELIGVDNAADYLQLAREHAQEKNVPIAFLQLSASELTAEVLGGPVDVLYVAHALLGFGDLHQTLARIMDCLTPGGRVVIVETDLTSWSISPGDEQWSERLQCMLRHVQETHGYYFDPRGIMPVLSRLACVEANFRTVTVSAELSKHPRFFLSYEVFYPEAEQDAAFDYICRVTNEALSYNRWGFKSYAVITAQKPC